MAAGHDTDSHVIDPNDFNSDLVAKLNPAQQTQLETGVELALLGTRWRLTAF